MVFLREKKALAWIVTLTHTHVKLILASWLIVLSVGAAALTGYVALDRDQQNTSSAQAEAQTARSAAQSARIEAQSAATAAQSTRELAAAIQESRIEAIRRDCVETNRRYKLSVKVLGKAIRRYPVGSKRRADAAYHRALTLPLLRTVTPRRKCAAAARRARVK